MNLIWLMLTVVAAALIFVLLLRVVKAALSAAISLILIALVLQFAFGIGIDDWFRELAKLWHSLEQAIQR